MENEVVIQNELQDKLAEKLTELERLESLRLMTIVGGVIAHELRTPLLSIRSGAAGIRKFLPKLLDGYKKWVAEDDRRNSIRPDQLLLLENILDDIEHSVKYCNSVIKALLDSTEEARQAEGEFRLIDVNSAIAEAITDYPLADEELNLVDFFPVNQPMILGNLQLLKKIITSFLKNALYVIKEVGRGRVELGAISGNGLVKIYCKDTAKGISDEVRDHLFDLFFTTKGADASIGYGLYYSKLAAEKMNGIIDCQSVENEYTLFSVSFPAA